MRTLLLSDAVLASHSVLNRNLVSGLVMADWTWGLRPGEGLPLACRRSTGKALTSPTVTGSVSATARACGVPFPFPIPSISEDHKPPGLVLISMWMFWSILN